MNQNIFPLMSPVRTVKNDLSNSAHDFLRVAWPALKNELGGGQVVPVEAVTAEGFKQQLDTLAGIDAWQVIEKDSVIRGIASRVQWIDARQAPYNTFTIRYRRASKANTEFHKRLQAIESSCALYPHLTTQAYVANPVRKGHLLSVCVADTAGLYRLAKQCEQQHLKDSDNDAYFIRYDHRYDDWGMNKTTNASFIWIKWDYAEKNGVHLSQFNTEVLRKAA